MQASVASDLHLEVCSACELPGGDLLLLAGDCFGAAAFDPRKTDADSRSARKRQIAFAKQQLSKYQRGLLVIGNHEHYGGLYEQTANTLRGFLGEYAPHVTLLDNERVEVEGVAVLGPTLWAKCGVGAPDASEWLIGREMRDFSRIKTTAPAPEGMSLLHGQRCFRPFDAHAEHQKALQFLEQAAAEANGKPIVLLTHHAPSFMSGHGVEYGSAYLDDAYCANLVDFFHRYPNIKLAIHGHTHHPEHYRIGATLVVSNPRGYFPYERRAKFFDARAEDFAWEELKQ